ALFLNCSHEVPIFREFPYTVALVTPEFANEQSDLVRRVAQTLGQANDMFATNFRQVVDVLKQPFARLPAKAMEHALQRAVDSYPRGYRMTPKMWENNIKVASETKMISAGLPTREGELLTNRFLS